MFVSRDMESTIPTEQYKKISGTLSFNGVTFMITVPACISILRCGQ